MNIKTKFNVGEEVYSVVFDTVSHKYISEKITIAEVNVLKNKTGTFIRYSSHIWGADSLFESDLFKNEEYCIAECQLRNLGLSHGR